jgi:hypothetical protein
MVGTCIKIAAFFASSALRSRLSRGFVLARSSGKVTAMVEQLHGGEKQYARYRVTCRWQEGQQNLTRESPSTAKDCRRIKPGKPVPE